MTWRRRQAVILTNAWLLLFKTLWTKVNANLIKTQNLSFTKIHLISSVKWPPFCPAELLNTSNNIQQITSGVHYFVMQVLFQEHYSDAIMSAMASQITSVSIVYSAVCWGGDQRKYQSSASLDFVREIHQWPVNSTHQGPVTRKMFQFNDVIMETASIYREQLHNWTSWYFRGVY